jgi:hypothetical protein
LNALLTNGAATFLDGRYLLFFVWRIYWSSLLQRVVVIGTRSHIKELIDWVEIGSVVISGGIQVADLIVRLVLFHLEVEDIAHD